MDLSRNEKCHAIIHGASVAAATAGAGLAQLPLADTIPITTIQIGMIMGIANVFDIEITEATAKALLGGFAASAGGRGLSQVLVGWIPGVGNVINSATAGAITEAIGWAAVTHFENQKKEKEKAEESAHKRGYYAGGRDVKEKFDKILEKLEKREMEYFLSFAVGRYTIEIKEEYENFFNCLYMPLTVKKNLQCLLEMIEPGVSLAEIKDIIDDLNKLKEINLKESWTEIKKVLSDIESVNPEKLKEIENLIIGKEIIRENAKSIEYEEKVESIFSSNKYKYE